jgi:hypothetical protein
MILKLSFISHKNLRSILLAARFRDVETEAHHGKITHFR